MLRFSLSAVILALVVQQSSGPPYSPQQALSLFRLEPGFRIELVASEPDIASPVAMDIDEDGRWYVVEMPGYPVDTSPSGKVKLLEDTNGDGRPDKTTLFADNLVLPTGIMRWKRGVLVTAAPDVLYLEDTNGDGRADIRKVVMTGFAFTNPQHTVNAPTYGLDNWIYLAHEGAAGALIYTDLFGDRGKPLTFPDRPDVAAVDPKNRSVRFRLDPHRIEVLSGRSQFGNTFDDFGRYFTSSNNDHIRHEVVAARYLERNPQLPVAAAMHSISDHGAAAKVFSITDRPQFELLTESGEFTSACSLTLYNGGAFPGEFGRSAFVAEPVHNLVHRDVLSPAGATFVASRGSKDREFLASTDAWFRPVNFYVGPDGALYVIDYYRARIEHPEWTASEFHKDPSQFSLGRDRGRIYRVVADTMPARSAPALSRATDAQLVDALSDANAWWRRTAQRLLVDRQSRDSVQRLQQLASEGASPLGRLHALWTLDGIGHLDAPLVMRALGDQDPGVRENALRLAEGLMDSDLVSAAVLARAVVEQDRRVQFQLLATLGGMNTPDGRKAQEQLLFTHLDDPWMQIAALSAGPDRPEAYLARALTPGSPARNRESDGHRAFFTLAASAVAGQQDAQVTTRVLESAASGGAGDAWWQAAVLDGLARGMRDVPSESLAPGRPRLVSLAEHASAAVRKGALALLARSGLGDGAAVTSAITRAVATATDATAAADRRADAVAFVTLAGAESRLDWLRSLVNPREPEGVQVAAVKALSTLRGEAVGDFVLSKWTTLTPATRSAAIDLLLADRPRQQLLVRALQQGTVQSWTMDFWQKRRLIMHRDEALRTAARALLEEHPEKRAALVNRYAASVERGGDRARGEQVYGRTCAACHKLGNGTTSDLGPDLATVRHRPPLALLVDILSPNQSIAQGYETYVIERVNGRSDAGTLAEQTPTTVTLRQAGQTTVIARRDIKQISMLPQSSMPSDLDKVISPDDMADLLAFLTRR